MCELQTFTRDWRGINTDLHVVRSRHGQSTGGTEGDDHKQEVLVCVSLKMIVVRGLLRAAAPLSANMPCYRYCSRLFCSEQKRQEKAARKAQEKAEKEAARLASAKDKVNLRLARVNILIMQCVGLYWEYLTNWVFIVNANYMIILLCNHQIN